MAILLVGWVDAWSSPYEQTDFTEDRKKAMIECVRYRHYNFTHQAHQTMPFCSPFYSDGKLCVLNKREFDEVMSAAYGDMPFGRRLMPQDAIKTPAEDDILFENKKLRDEFKKGANHNV